MKRRQHLSFLMSLLMGGAALLLTAAVGRAEVPMPEKAVSSDTAAVMWVDFSHLTPEALTATSEAIKAALPEDIEQDQGQGQNAMGPGGPGMGGPSVDIDAQMEQGLEKVREFREAMQNAGAQGMLLIAQGPGAAGSPPPEPVALLRVAEGTSPEQVEAAISEWNSSQQPDLAEYAEGWMIEASKLSLVSTEGDAATVGAFQELLANTPDAVVRIAFRSTDSLKQMIQGEAQAGNPQHPEAMAAQAVRELESAWASVAIGREPNFSYTLRFANAQAAEEFALTWESMLMMGQSMLMQQLTQMPDGPEPQTVRDLFNALAMQQAGQQVSQTLTTDVLGPAAEIGKPFLPLIMMQMMGPGMGPGGPGMGPGGGQQGPGAPPQF